MNLGGPPKIFEVLSPHKKCFIAYLRKNFQNLEFYPPQFFFEKISKISKKFPEILSTFSKSIKTFIFVPKLVQNHYIDQNLAKFSHETQKMANFSLKFLIF